MIRRQGRGTVLHQVVEHAGVLYVGGVVADDPRAGMYEQTRQALGKLSRILEENGSDARHLLCVQAFITDMSRKPEMNRAWTEFFEPDHLPARATLGIGAIEEGVLIELVATAAVRTSAPATTMS